MFHRHAIIFMILSGIHAVGENWARDCLLFYVKLIGFLIL